MSTSSIEWTDRTWNPVTGCSKVSEGCRNCYAEAISLRFKRSVGPWNAVNAAQNVVLHPDRLDMPLRWKQPAKVFVNSMSDLFHELVDEKFIAKVFAIMANAPRHTFQVLTKRSGRMAQLLNDEDFQFHVGWFQSQANRELGLNLDLDALPTLPLPNVWLGTSVEDQRAADARIPHLLNTPATVRFLSCEPLLGPVDLTIPCPNCTGRVLGPFTTCLDCLPAPQQLISPGETGTGRVIPEEIGWVIAGGESGPRARPMHPDWARSLRDQCIAAGVPFFFKQWGEWLPGTVDPERFQAHHQDGSDNSYQGKRDHWWDGVHLPHHPGGASPGLLSTRVGKANAGRLLDGREWNEFPKTLEVATS